MKIQEVRRYLTGGKATFTLSSHKTGTHYTYRVAACESAHQLFFVAALRGPENERDYAYIGRLVASDDAPWNFTHTRKSSVQPESPTFQGFSWFVARLNAGKPMDRHFVPSNTCARCGRLLTVPTSVHAGFGPECAKKMES